jgi:hypothetical protein
MVLVNYIYIETRESGDSSTDGDRNEENDITLV